MFSGLVAFLVTIMTNIFIHWVVPILKIRYQGKENSRLEQEKGNINKSLQIDSFYRKTSNEEVIRLISDWTGFLNIVNNEDKGPNIFELKTRTLTFGSKETAIILAKYFEFVYLNVNEDLSEPFEPYGAQMILYVATLISSLKFDYTGFWVNPIDILKIYSSDYKCNSKIYEESYKLVEKNLSFLKEFD